MKKSVYSIQLKIYCLITFLAEQLLVMIETHLNKNINHLIWEKKQAYKSYLWINESLQFLKQLQFLQTKVKLLNLRSQGTVLRSLI